MAKRTPENIVKDALKEALTAEDIHSYAYTTGFGGRRGFPDRFAVVRGHTVWFECKAAGKRAVAEQLQVHKELRADGATVFMVWPHNIEEVVRLTIELRTDHISRGLGGPTKERLFPESPESRARARANKKQRPPGPTLSSGATDPEQHSFAAALGYQSPEQDPMGLPLAHHPRT